MSQPKILQLNVRLVDAQPLIWRQLEIGEDATLTDLHEAVQASMDWENTHMHQFRLGERVFGPAYDTESGDEAEDENECILAEAFSEKGAKVYYDYDFGDNWVHEITLEGKVVPEEDVRYPRCTGGARAAPPEDCGGLPGYENLLQTLQDPKHPDHEDAIAWLGTDDFDPEHVSIDEINERLAYSADEEFYEEADEDEDEETLDEDAVEETIIAIVESHIENDDPPAARTALKRLANAGLGEDEAWDLIAAAYALETYRSFAEHREFDTEAYSKILKGLPKLPLA